MTDITDRSPVNLDFAVLSKRGCTRCNAGAGEPHTFVCVNTAFADLKARTDWIETKTRGGDNTSHHHTQREAYRRLFLTAVDAGELTIAGEGAGSDPDKRAGE